MQDRSLETCELTFGYPFPMHSHCVLRSIFNSGQHFTLSFSTCSSHAAVGTSDSASPGFSTGYEYTKADEHSLLVFRMAVEHSLLVYRMAVEHSLLRRPRSGRS